jgi:glycerol kinase
VSLDLLKVDGGMCVNDRLMQIQADLLGVVRYVATTTTPTNQPCSLDSLLRIALPQALHGILHGSPMLHYTALHCAAMHCGIGS